MKNLRECYLDNERWRLTVAVLLGMIAAPLVNQGRESETLEELVISLLAMSGLAVFVSLVAYHITLTVKPIKKKAHPFKERYWDNEMWRLTVALLFGVIVGGTIGDFLYQGDTDTLDEFVLAAIMVTIPMTVVSVIGVMITWLVKPVKKKAQPPSGEDGNGSP